MPDSDGSDPSATVYVSHSHGRIDCGLRTVSGGTGSAADRMGLMFSRHHLICGVSKFTLLSRSIQMRRSLGGILEKFREIWRNLLEKNNVMDEKKKRIRFKGSERTKAWWFERCFAVADRRSCMAICHGRRDQTLHAWSARSPYTIYIYYALV